MLVPGSFRIWREDGRYLVSYAGEISLPGTVPRTLCFQGREQVRAFLSRPGSTLSEDEIERLLQEVDGGAPAFTRMIPHVCLGDLMRLGFI